MLGFSVVVLTVVWSFTLVSKFGWWFWLRLRGSFLMVEIWSLGPISYAYG